MLLSNRWGKSEGDHIILQSLKINYANSFCLLSPILFTALFCLFLGMRTVRWLGHVTQFCHPPFPCRCSRDPAAELQLRLLQFSVLLCSTWCLLIPRGVWEGGREEGKEGREEERKQAKEGRKEWHRRLSRFCGWLCHSAHTSVSISTIHHQPSVQLLLCNFFSHLAFLQFDFICLFHTFEEHRVAFLFYVWFP